MKFLSGRVLFIVQFFVVLHLHSSLSAFAFEVSRERILKNGARAFKYCANCHTLGTSGTARYGPDLKGVVNRPIASAPGYEYSAALKAKGGIWSKGKLNRFIARPSHAVDGTKMPYAGLLSPHARADLIEYLAEASLQRSVVPAIDNLAEALAKGNPDKGGLLFVPCLTCHTASEGAGHSIGPNLFKIVGRPVASAPDFYYSNRLVRRGGTWTPENLNAFFFETKEFDQGTHAAYLKLTQLEDRAHLIAYLQTLSPTGLAPSPENASK